MSETRIGILGAAGRMGRMLIRVVAEADGLCLAGAAEMAGHAACGEDAGTLAGLAPMGVAVAEADAAFFQAAEAVIDFTLPAATAAHAKLAGETQTPLVLGTTGLDAAATQALAAAAKKVAIVQAPNMSLAVNLLFALARRASEALGPAYDAAISEIHHRKKLDAPSGTALALRDAAVAGGRKEETIAMTSVRAGDVVGEHAILFAGAGEQLTLGHRASTREVFARGAVHAARWVAGRPPGHYDMMDVLGLD